MESTTSTKDSSGDSSIRHMELSDSMPAAAHGTAVTATAQACVTWINISTKTVNSATQLVLVDVLTPVSVT